MPNIGSYTASLVLNADAYTAGAATAVAASKKMESTIGGTFDRISKKQISQATSDIIKNFLGPVALINMGTGIVTDLVKGISEGSTTFENAGRKLMESLAKGLSDVPIVGGFVKLGEAIGNAFFGVDAANAMMEQSKNKIKEITGLVVLLQDASKSKVDAEKSVQKQIDDMNKSASQKELELFTQTQKTKQDLIQKNLISELEARQKTQFDAMPKTVGDPNSINVAASAQAGRSIYSKETVNPALNEQLIKNIEELQRLQVRTDADSAAAIANAVQAQTELITKRDEAFKLADKEKSEQAQINALRENYKDSLASINYTERELLIDKLMHLTTISDLEKNSIVNEFDKLAAAKQNLDLIEKRKAAIKKLVTAEQASSKAKDDIDSRYNELQDKNMKASRITGVQSALGTLRVRDAVSGVITNDQLDPQIKALKAAESSAESLKQIAKNLGGSP